MESESSRSLMPRREVRYLTGRAGFGYQMAIYTVRFGVCGPRMDKKARSRKGKMTEYRKVAIKTENRAENCGTMSFEGFIIESS
jgi:hypothetical protein